MLRLLGLGAKALASSYGHSPLTGDSHPLLKRWYGVQPSSDIKHNQEGHTYPWPVKCTDPQYYQPIYYCFKDHRSANNLHDILMNAISIWAHAIEATALSIDLPPPVGGDSSVLCGDQRLVDYQDALVISDETEDGDDSWNQSDGCQSATTVGYQWVASEDVAEPYRHYLGFCPTKFPTQAEKVQRMAHELSHAMGLQNEHQRPDRNTYLTFNCPNLPGYSQAASAVGADAQNLLASNMTTAQRLQKACTNIDIATAYLPSAVPYLQGPQNSTLPSLDTTSHQLSDHFDYDSMMMLPGSPNSILIRKDNGQATVMGGSSDPASSKISEGDVARIAMLYNAHTEACTAAMNGTNWGPVNIKIRDFEATVQPPRKRNETFEILTGVEGAFGMM